jgi:LuxR family maltose regulon positive regulatory protein
MEGRAAGAGRMPASFAPRPRQLGRRASEASSGIPLVRRAGLLRRLADVGDEVSLVVVEAPRGYGKTTTVRQWADSSAAYVCWAPVRARHGDPGRLAAALMTALLEVRVPSAPGVAGTVSGTALEQVASRIGQVARAGPVTLVLDDLQQARGRGAVDMVAALAALMPAGSRIVVTSDRPLRWRVGTLVAERRYLRFGSEDLTFDAGETAALLAAAGLEMPPEAVDELVGRTGGWAMGLHLALPALAASLDPSDCVRTLDGDDAVFRGYFRQQVLAGLSAETMAFLMRTAVLERVSGPLCDTVLGTSGSGGRLAEVRDLGLHVEPDDETGDWYRYHPLFAQMLTGELRRREPGRDLSIHRSASLWYEAQGRLDMAIEHALAGRADVTAGRLIVAHTQVLNSQGRIAEVRRWLDRLGEDVLASYPPLAPMAAWVWALTGDGHRARRALGVAEAGSFQGPLPDGSACLESAVLRVRAALAPRGVQAMLADARRAVALEPAGSRWHSMASLLLGVASWLNGSFEDAVPWLESAQQFGTASQGPGAASALAQLAWLAAQREDWPMAQACADDSTEHVLAGGLQGYMPSLLSYLVNARVALHRGHADQATIWTRRALDLYVWPSPVAFPWLAVQAAVTLGRLQLELGDPRAATARLAEARADLRLLRPPGVLAGLVEELERELADAQGYPEPGGDSLSAAELRVLRLLPSHLSLAQIADEFVVSRNTVKGHVSAIYRKLGVGNRTEAVHRALEAGLLEEAPR